MALSKKVWSKKSGMKKDSQAAAYLNAVYLGGFFLGGAITPLWSTKGAITDAKVDWANK